MTNMNIKYKIVTKCATYNFAFLVDEYRFTLSLVHLPKAISDDGLPLLEGDCLSPPLLQQCSQVWYSLKNCKTMT